MLTKLLVAFQAGVHSLVRIDMKVQWKKVAKSFFGEMAYRFQRPKPRRILFDHLPKCGGTSAKEYLRSNYPEHRVFKTGQQPHDSVMLFQSFPENVRYGYHLVLGHDAHKLLDYVHPDTMALTIFRDPIERIISHYFFVKQNHQHYLHDRVMNANMSLEDYVLSGLSSELRNWYTTHFSGLSVDEAETDPEQAVNKATQIILERYDIVGFLDDLETTMERLRERGQLKRRLKKTVLNKTRNKPPLEDITERVIHTIARVNSLDVRLYENLKKRLV